jgi:hypothetical protein
MISGACTNSTNRGHITFPWIGHIGDSAWFSTAIDGWQGEVMMGSADCTSVVLLVVNSKDSCFSIAQIKWPPKDWREMNSDKKLHAWEFVSTQLEFLLTGSFSIDGWQGEVMMGSADCTSVVLLVVNSKDSCFSIFVINISGMLTILAMS